MQKHDPFRPNKPVYATMFVGRELEIKRINDTLFQTTGDNPTNLMIIGERGIGKSSLLLLAKVLAESRANDDKGKYDFLTVSVIIDKNTTQHDLMTKIEKSLFRGLKPCEKTLSFLKDSWKFLQRVEVGGIKLKEAKSDNKDLLDNFIYSIVDTVKSISDSNSSFYDIRCKKDGLVIFIDEADKANPELDLGVFLKILTETLVLENCYNVLIIIAGLPLLRDVLRNSHESSLRIFEELELSTLSPKEVEMVILHGLAEASNKNEAKYTTDAKALKLFYDYSEGYPHFVQQLGSSTFTNDADNHISEEDVRKGMFMKGGALDQIGNRYFYKNYFSYIKEDSYRTILMIMSDKWNQWISKQEIKSKFKGAESKLNNGLRALCERNIILRHPSLRGKYRLQWVSFALWIKMITSRDESSENI